MNKKTKKFSYLLTFLIAGVSLLAGMVFINPAKNAVQVGAEDKYYGLVGTFNGWNNNDPAYVFTKIDESEYRYTGLLSDGAAGVEFKVITAAGSWDNALGYDKLDDATKDSGHFHGEGSGNITILPKNTGIVISINPADNKITVSVSDPTYLDIVKASTAGVDLNHMRVWLHRGVFEFDGALNALQFGPSGTVDNNTTIVEASGYVEFMDGDWLAYFDLLTTELVAGMDIRVARVSSDRKLIWNTSEVYSWQEGDNNRLLYVGSQWNGNTASLSVGIVGDDKEIPVTFTKYVLEGYLTCSPSTINGYGAFPEVNRSFFKKDDGEWKIVGISDEVKDLGDIMISDYASMDTSYTGGRLVNNVTGWEKYSLMETLYLVSSGGSGAPSIFTNNNSITFVILISVIGITSLAALYFLRKKKTA